VEDMDLNIGEKPEETKEILVFTLAIILILIGVIYIIFWICRCGDKSQKFKDYDA
jgi:hypothetical protein